MTTVVAKTGGKTFVELLNNTTLIQKFDAVINVVEPQLQDNRLTVQHCDQNPELTPEKIDADEIQMSALTFDAVYDPAYVLTGFNKVRITLPKFLKTKTYIADGKIYGGAQTYTVNSIVWARYTINVRDAGTMATYTPPAQ